MKAVTAVALVIHVLSVIGILVLLLLEAKNRQKQVKNGVLHASWTALLAGLVLVGTTDKNLNMGAIGLKAIILAVIIALGYQAKAKGRIANGAWLAMIVLTVVNILIASFSLN